MYMGNPITFEQEKSKKLHKFLLARNLVRKEGKMFIVDILATVE